VISDQADAMLAGARERAAELGLANVEFQAINAEWIDLPVASVDAVLCSLGLHAAGPTRPRRWPRRAASCGRAVASHSPCGDSI